MKKEARLLRDKAIDSLILSIEHFNRPSDTGRTDAVLILLDHAFEMLLKACILHRGGIIRQEGAKQTIGFDHCIRKALSDGKLRFLKDEEALLLQAINGLRDAAQHHLVDISEAHLYIQAQAGLSLFARIFREVFKDDLCLHLPERVLPVSTRAPADLSTLFENESEEIRKLLAPGNRRGVEAKAKLRSLAIVEGAFAGEKVQPSERDLSLLARSLSTGKKWTDIFPGVSSINFSTKGFGPSIDLRITKAEGTPVVLVPENTPGAMTVAVKRVDDLGFYNMGRDQVAKKVGLSGPKTTAFIRFSKIQNDPECYKFVRVGGTAFHRYSQKAISTIQTAMKQQSIDGIWSKFGPKRGVSKL